MATKRLSQQEDLYLSEGQSTSFTYGDPTYRVRISGGSGTGALHFRTSPITGKGTINASTGVFQFVYPGTVWVEVYKDGSETSQIIYEQSKTLVIELTLNQRQLTVSVVNDVEVEIGEDVPSISQNNYSVEELLSGDSLSQLPEIYFVHDSDDFYKENVLGKSNFNTLTQNGITYQALDNRTWKVSGTATSNSSYYFISSDSPLPTYLVAGKRYSLEVSAGTPETTLKFRSRGILSATFSIPYNPTSTSSIKFSVPVDVDSAELFWSISSGTTVDVTCTLELLDTRVDILHEGKYPIAARGAEAPNNVGYASKIKYKSKNVVYQNTNYYNIYASYNDLGVVSTSVTSAKPYDTVLFTVKAYTGAQYFDYDHHNSSESQLQIVDESGHTVSYTRVGSAVFNPSDDTGSTGCLVGCTYSFIMPVRSSVRIICTFYNWASSSNIPAGYAWPYTDSFLNSKQQALSFWSNSGHAQDYVDASMFCYYARQFFFGDIISEARPPLMWGRDVAARNKFYTDSQGIIQSYLTRRDLISCIRRLSHAYYYNYGQQTESAIATRWRDGYNGTSDPDYLLHTTAANTDTPGVYLFSYAGHTVGGDSTGLIFGNSDTPKVSPPVWSTPYPGVYYNTTDPALFSTDQTTYAIPSDELIKTGPTISDYAWSRTWVPATATVPRHYEYTRVVYNRNQYANDDYLLNYRYFNDISWGGWLGVMQGESSISFDPLSAATVQEAATVLWRYGVFRQFSVKESKQLPYSDSDASVWAQNGPVKWMRANGLIHSKDPYGNTLDSHSNIDRAEFAYMLMRFCMLYSW